MDRGRKCITPGSDIQRTLLLTAQQGTGEAGSKSGGGVGWLSWTRGLDPSRETLRLGNLRLFKEEMLRNLSKVVK